MKAPLKVAGYVHPPLELQFARSIVPEQIASIQAYCRQRGFAHVITVVETAYDGQQHYGRLAELVTAACRPERPYDLLVVPWWSHVTQAGPALERMEAMLLGAGLTLVAISDRSHPKHDVLVGGRKW